MDGTLLTTEKQLTAYTKQILQEAIEQGIDIISETKVVEHLNKRILVRDTDNGKNLQEQIEDLKELLVAYRKGVIR